MVFFFLFFFSLHINFILYPRFSLPNPKVSAIPIYSPFITIKIYYLPLDLSSSFQPELRFKERAPDIHRLCLRSSYILRLAQIPFSLGLKLDTDR